MNNWIFSHGVIQAFPNWNDNSTSDKISAHSGPFRTFQ